MKKFLKWTAIVIGTLLVLMFGAFKYMQHQTKKASPEATVEYSNNGKKISVFYCRPSVRGRVVFDSLVPYGKVWRTGANEATTFTTDTDIEFGGKNLPKGKYTLWTIPDKNEWTVILNSKEYGWGVNFDGEAARKPEADVLQVKVPAETLPERVEMLTISFTESPALAMNIVWDKTKVSVPIK